MIETYTARANQPNGAFIQLLLSADFQSDLYSSYCYILNCYIAQKRVKYGMHLCLGRVVYFLCLWKYHYYITENINY